MMLLGVMVATLAARAATQVNDLKVEGLRSPLGIDTPAPRFSWQLESDQRDVQQTAYQITVFDAAGGEVWNSGRVESPVPYGIKYEGTPLKSCAAYTWTVTVETTDGSATAASTFETAFMDASQWTGRWIHTDVSLQTLDGMSIVFDTPVTCRYVRLDVSELGLRASTDAGFSFVQLAEMEVYSGTDNVARSASLSVGKSADSWELTQFGWSLANLTDGVVGGSALGWTTEQNVAVPVVVTLDLGQIRTIDRIVLYPRQNDHAVGKGDDIAANFPAAFTILTSSDGRTYNETFRQVAKKETSVPYFGRTFTLNKKVARARIYASALGVFTLRLNGQPVTDAVLEPGESEYEKTLLYSTYDVTDLLREGRNALIAQVAGGIYNIDYLDDRYSKGEVQNNGTTALMAELLLEYADGTSERIVTDTDWRWQAGPTLGSNWWGGEDYDARLVIPELNNPAIDLSAWNNVSILTPHFRSPHSGVSGHGTLRSRMYEPLRVVEEWPAVEVKTIQSGGYTLRMVDFGRNFAGQYRFRLKGRAGQQISLRCGESLNPDGSIYMENFYTGPANTYEVYTFRGDEEGETWGPEFMYHGFRYLQIIGLDDEPDAASFTAMRIRSDVDNVGALKTSNSLIDQIHVICRDAIASQLYNSITDCPHREKLGWLDVPNEMYVSLNSNFDMQNFYNKVVLDCFDAQQSDGHVPSVAPYYMNVYGDDVNWGGAAILVPYRNWRYYGDTSLLEQFYAKMKRLMRHFSNNTTDYIINNSFSALSDWGQETAGVSPMVPTEFTETCTYYYLARVMAEAAEQFGSNTDVRNYARMADNIKRAFNKKFYNATTATYTSVSGGGGRQSEQAMPLYYGLVPEGDEQRVADVLAERVRQDGYKIKTGEIALKCVFMTLAQYGYNDIVWQMANQTDCPSYGWWVTQGYTTTPEYWDVGAFSQNHCMMDHIEEWFFTQLAGIRNTGTAFDTFTIAPYLPADLDHLDIATQTRYGQVRSAWQRSEGSVAFQFSVPCGSVATIVVPCADGLCLMENGKPIAANEGGIHSVEYTNGQATVVCGSGRYEWVTATDPTPTGIGEIKNEELRMKNEVLTGEVYDLQGHRVGIMKNDGNTYSSFGGEADILHSSLSSGIYIIAGQQKVLHR